MLLHRRDEKLGGEVSVVCGVSVLEYRKTNVRMTRRIQLKLRAGKQEEPYTIRWRLEIVGLHVEPRSGMRQLGAVRRKRMIVQSLTKSQRWHEEGSRPDLTDGLILWWRVASGHA